MKKYLHKIVEAQFGVSKPGKKTGDYPYIQGRDFGSDGEYLGIDPLYIDSSELLNTPFLQKGDILFSTKGKIFATVWQAQVNIAIASGTFLILKVKTNEVTPEYLAMFLNSSRAQKYYDLHIKMATVKHIGRKQLDLLEIEIPSIETQKQLVEFHKLLLEEKRITNELQRKKEKILNYLI